MPERAPVPRYVIPAMFAAFAAWGAFIAVGAFLQGWDWRKGALVLVCVAAFLGLWAAALGPSPAARKNE